MQRSTLLTALAVLLMGYSAAFISAQSTLSENRSRPQNQHENPSHKSQPNTTSTDENKPKTSPEDEEQPLAKYYDSRERISAMTTFVWKGEKVCTLRPLTVQRIKQASVLLGIQPTYDEGVYQSGENIIVTGLQDTFIIERTPKLTRFHRNKEIPYAGADRIGKSEDRVVNDTYFLGETGEVMIVYESSLPAELLEAEVFDWGHNGFGFYTPTRGIFVGEMCFLGGVSPLRLFGTEPSDWQLIRVSEEEWVFEITEETVKQKRLDDYLAGLVRVRVHLDRTHGDAFKRAEIVMGDTPYLWEAQEYKQIQGVWMPAQVVFRYSSPYSEITYVYTLERAEPTKGAVEIQIPRGTLVKDWRALKRSAFQPAMEAPFITYLLRRDEGSEEASEPLPPFALSEWCPELLRSLWRTASSGGR